jgi:hypothetical protein
MKSLEIKVKDNINIHDSLDEAVCAVEKIIREWFNSEDSSPLTITLSKIEDRGPPALGINVNDGIKTKEALT